MSGKVLFNIHILMEVDEDKASAMRNKILEFLADKLRCSAARVHNRDGMIMIEAEFCNPDIA